MYAQFIFSLMRSETTHTPHEEMHDSGRRAATQALSNCSTSYDTGVLQIWDVHTSCRLPRPAQAGGGSVPVPRTTYRLGSRGNPAGRHTQEYEGKGYLWDSFEAEANVATLPFALEPFNVPFLMLLLGGRTTGSKLPRASLR